MQQGDLSVTTSSGSFAFGLKDVKWDLKTTANPRITWKGETLSSTTELTLQYSGDQSGPRGENILYLPTTNKITFPPEIDLEPPMISIVGVSDNGEYEPGQKVSITVTDNFEAAVVCNGVLSFGNKTIPISFSCNELGNHCTAEFTFTEETLYTIDLQVSDAQQNEAQALVSFKIAQKKAPPPPPRVFGSFQMSDYGRDVLRSYRSELDRELDSYESMLRRENHMKTCSICSNGGMKLVDPQAYKDFKRMMKQKYENLANEEGDGGALGGPVVPPGWEEVECLTIREMDKSDPNRYKSDYETASKRQKAWNAFIKSHYHGYDDAKDFVNEETYRWTEEYSDLIFAETATVEEAKANLEKIMENHIQRKYMNRLKEEGLSNEDSRIWDKYSAMQQQLVKSFPEMKGADYSFLQ